MKKLVLSALSIAMIITLAYVLFPDQNHARNEDKKKPLVERKVYNPSQKDKKKHLKNVPFLMKHVCITNM